MCDKRIHGIGRVRVRDLVRRTYAALPVSLQREVFRFARPTRFRSLQQLRKEPVGGGYSLKPFDDYKCIFIHIPKCAGISVARALFGCLAGGHITVPRYQLAFGQARFDEYFKFTFVRNPWDRVVSAYFFLRGGGLAKADRAWADQNLSEFRDFSHFVRGGLGSRRVQAWRHFTPQWRWFCDGRGTPRVDFMGYFENLLPDYECVRARIGCGSSLAHANRTPDRAADYRDYYEEDTRRIVGRIYRHDVDLLGYDFDGSTTEQQLARRSPDAGSRP